MTVDSPLEICCSVNTADITNSDDVTISWTGPIGTTITNDSRLTITPTVSNGTNHISTLNFLYLSEDDEGLYECSTSVLGYDENKTASVELVNFTSEFDCMILIESKATAYYLCHKQAMMIKTCSCTKNEIFHSYITLFFFSLFIETDQHVTG